MPNFKTKHGHCIGGKPTPEYMAWQGAIDRTTNPHCRKWTDYGKRGINICECWHHSFATFLADMGPRPNGLTLDRRDNNLGYLCPRCCPPDGNCRWATRSEQQFNRRPETAFTRYAVRPEAYRYQITASANSARRGSKASPEECQHRREAWAKLSPEQRRQRTAAANKARWKEKHACEA